MKKAKIVQEEGQEIPAEIIAQSIVKIAKSMEAIGKTRLTRKAIVVLIHDQSKVSKRTIELVLNNLEAMEQVWLKKPQG